MVDAQKEATEFEYNSTNDMTGIIDAKGNKFTYVYDSRHNVTKGTSAQGVVYKLAYDSAGNVTKSGCVDPAAETNGIWMERTLTSDKNHVSAVIDAQGNRVEYTWDTSNDLLTAMKDGRGNTISYGYDSANRLTSVSQDVTMDGETKTVANTYAYTDDKDGRELTTAAGSHVRTTAYDKFGRVTSQGWNTTTPVSVSYEYGQVSTEKHCALPSILHANGTDLLYSYDANGNIISILEMEGTSEILKSYEYDELNQLIRENDKAQGKAIKL